MPKTLKFSLAENELEQISKAVKSDKRPEVRQRAMGLRLLHEGQSPKQVATLMAVSQPTVYDWRHRWQESGLEGLANRPKSGRPRKADTRYVELLEKVIDQDPQELGYAFTIWTADRLRFYMEKETGSCWEQHNSELYSKPIVLYIVAQSTIWLICKIHKPEKMPKNGSKS
jgi:transposase